MLLLFITITTNAKAEDENNYLAQKEEKHKRKAEKIIGLLKAVGLTHPIVAETTYYVQKNIHDDYFYFTEKKYDNYSLGLRHEVGTPKFERLELFYQPDDSDYVYTVSPEAALIRYKVEF